MSARRSLQSIRTLVLLLLTLFITSCLFSEEDKGTIEGRVEDRQGDALSAVQLSTEPPTTSTTTNADGNFRIDGVAAGTYTVVANKEGFEQQRKSIDVQAGSTGSVDITLVKSTGIILGKVVSADTQIGVPEATVTTSPTTTSVSTDAQGNYTITDVPTGTYSINASVTGCTNNSIPGVVVTASQTTSASDLSLTCSVAPELGVIGGTVTDATTSANISGAIITTAPATQTVTTDASGSYTIQNVLVDVYTVYVTAGGCTDQSRTAVQVQKANVSTQDFELTCVNAPGTIIGRVIDNDTNIGISAAIVWTIPPSTNGNSDASGNYSLTGVPVGTYQVRASVNSYLDSWVYGVIVTTDSVVTAPDIRLPPEITNGTIHGRVVDSSTNFGVVGAVVTTSPATSTTYTDGSGYYSITGVARGTYTVQATATSYATSSFYGVVVATGNAIAAVPNIGLAPYLADATIQGRVIDSSTNIGISGAVVTTSPPTFVVYTDGDGYYRIDGLAAGTYTVQASTRSYEHSSVDGVVVATDEAIIDAADIGLTKNSPTSPWWWGPDMPTARQDLAAAEINGKLYVVGGFNGGSLNALEIYDPSLGGWIASTPMITARNVLAAVAIDGKLYAVGGYRGDFQDALEIYDPVSKTWAIGSKMPTARGDIAAATIDGKIYVVGGYDGAPLNKLEIYDTANDIWTTGPSMPISRQSPAAVAIGGKLYVVGGNSNGNYLRTLAIYDPLTSTWTTGSPMPTGRHRLAAGVIDGKLYAVGGTNDNTLSTLEIYNPATDTWTTGDDMPTARTAPAAAVFDGKLYVIGGSGTAGKLRTLEYFVP
jgi:N-acetylneuraminic acid mutarotase